MLPKVIYEALPWAYLISSVALILTSQDLIVLGFSWLLYTGGAITWLLRSDHRRFSKKISKSGESEFKIPDDIYESLPFGYIGIGAISFSFSGWWLGYTTSLMLMFAGMLILGIRTKKRKFSWIDDWRKEQAKKGVLSEKRKVQSLNSSETCGQCQVRPQCRTTGLTDHSNNRVMSWLLDEKSMTEFAPLKEELNQLEPSPVSEIKLRVLLIKLKPFLSQCIGLEAHQCKQQCHGSS